jgi:hypothetical protein
MYKGYNIKLSKNNFEDYYSFGLKLYDAQKANVLNNLEKFLSPKGVLNMSEIQENWFPKIDSKVFISHSHMDKDLAIALSGWLKEKFNLTSFIDSCVWGYSNDLLRKIDNEYCKNNKGSYDYQSRNSSTSHVHIMLSTALSLMIDKCECLFFLNTPNSLKKEELVNNKTNSPWIYSEITVSRLIEKKTPNRHILGYRSNILKKAEPGVLNEGKRVEGDYNLELNHLKEISYKYLLEWEKRFNTVSYLNTSDHALDCLYFNSYV